MTSSSDDEEEVTATFTSMSKLGEPYCRDQGSYLFNLQKILNEAPEIGAEYAIRWHRKILNALEINWSYILQNFDSIHLLLVQYKLSRVSNRCTCVRPTMNRKLREWNFKMVSSGGDWVVYIYQDAGFHPYAGHRDLPTRRRITPGT